MVMNTTPSASVNACYKTNTTTTLFNLTSYMVMGMMMYVKVVAVMEKMS
jgi:hypothetical protein